MNKPKGTPTHTNLYVLNKHFGAANVAPARIEVVDAPHLRRCLKAGLCVTDGTNLHLTVAGQATLAEYRERNKR